MRYLYECKKCGEVLELSRSVRERDNPVSKEYDDECEHDWFRRMSTPKVTKTDTWAGSPGGKGNP